MFIVDTTVMTLLHLMLMFMSPESSTYILYFKVYVQVLV